MACTNQVQDKSELPRIINTNLIEFGKSLPDEDLDEYVNPSSNELFPSITNDTLFAKFKLINSGGYHFKGDLKWQGDTLTLVLFDNNSELMFEEYTFKVKLHNKKPILVRYQIEY